MTIINLIRAGLGIVQQFRDLAGNNTGGEDEPATEVTVRDESLVVRRGERDLFTVGAQDLRMSEAESRRFRALDQRVRTNWNIYHDTYATLPQLGPAEKARVRSLLEDRKSELCQDLVELITVYERAIGRELPSTFGLNEMCE